MTEIERIDAVVLSPEEESRIDDAIRNAVEPIDDEVAVSARYDAGTDMLLLVLKNGQKIGIPRGDLQGLSAASPAELAEVEIVGLGTAVHWEGLMQGYEVDELRRGLYGSRRWMEGLAQRRRDRLQVAS